MMSSGTATVTLPTDEQILITREFDAPRRLVYEAFTTPEHREIVPDERIVSTEAYEGLPEGVSEEEGATVNTATFAEANGRTTVAILVQAASKVSRDAIIDSGMEAGLQDALDLLEQVALSRR